MFSNDAERASILEGRKDDVARSCGLPGHHWNDVTPPKGCGQKLVDDKLSVLVDLKGLVDADAEIKKLQKELKTVEPLVAELEGSVEDPRYLAKAPEKQRCRTGRSSRVTATRRRLLVLPSKQWEI